MNENGSRKNRSPQPWHLFDAEPLSNFSLKSGGIPTAVVDRRMVNLTMTGVEGSVQEIGRLLISALGIKDSELLTSRISAIIEEKSSRSIKELNSRHWERIQESLEWIGSESGLWPDVVRLCKVLGSITNDKQAKMDFHLRASAILKSIISDPNGALDELLEAHKSDPFSISTIKLICSRIRLLEKDVTYDEKLYLWERFISSYREMIEEDALSEDRQVGLLLLMSWICHEGAGDVAKSFDYIAKAHWIDPSSEPILDRMEAMAMTHGYVGRLLDHLDELLVFSRGEPFESMLKARRKKLASAGERRKPLKVERDDHGNSTDQTAGWQEMLEYTFAIKSSTNEREIN